MDYGNTKTPSMHPRLGCATLLVAGFPRGRQPEFPMGEIPLGQYSCKKKKVKKKKQQNTHTHKKSKVLANTKIRKIPSLFVVWQRPRIPSIAAVCLESTVTDDELIRLLHSAWIKDSAVARI